MVKQKLNSKILDKLMEIYPERSKNSLQARISQISKDEGITLGAAAEIIARKKKRTVNRFLDEEDKKCFRESKIEVIQKTKNNQENKIIDPFTIPLSKFNISSDLAKECKIKKPYSKEINHAILNLEDFMRQKMNLDESIFGKGLVEEAKRKGIFSRKLESESQGLYFLYMSAILWLRNGGFHKKKNAEKDECFKIIMFVDYLIKLFDKLYDEK